jgi:hypothetical protein
MFTSIRACRICGNPNLASIVHLGDLALTGYFPRPDQSVPAGPLELVKCTAATGADACGLVQLRQSYSPSDLFTDHYGYRSSLNQSMVRHLGSIVSRVQSLVALQPGDLVLDIGSNDCTTLGLYNRTDLDLVGVDACGHKFAPYYPAHIRLIADFFSASKIRALVGSKRARVITSIAMFYDLEAPLAFVREIHDMLASDGVWIFEQSYLPMMIDNTSYDTICHEHLEYYALRQIQWMLERADMKILDVTMNDTNGGSFQVTAARKEAPYPEASQRVAQVLVEEQRREFESKRPYVAFRDRVLGHRDVLRLFIGDAKRAGKKVLGYGASTKGNVILQYCGLTRNDIPCIAEVNEEKFGCVTPLTNIPIVPEQEARAQKPDYFLVLPWHFRESILRRETQYLASGGQFLFPLPLIEAVGQTAIARAA